MAAKKRGRPKGSTNRKTTKRSEVKFLKNLYEDFKETFGEVFGDAGDLWGRHKLLVIVAFLGFLYYRNKQFSIAEFVEKIENKIKKDTSW